MTHGSQDFGIGAWCWHERHAAPCRVVDREEMWGETAYRVWLPDKPTSSKQRYVLTEAGLKLKELRREIELQQQKDDSK